MLTENIFENVKNRDDTINEYYQARLGEIKIRNNSEKYKSYSQLKKDKILKGSTCCRTSLVKFYPVCTLILKSTLHS